MYHNLIFQSFWTLIFKFICDVRQILQGEKKVRTD